MKSTTKMDICIPQADVYKLVIDVTGGPDSLAGYVGEMQIRKTVPSDVVLADMDPGWFTVDDLNRQVVLEVPDTATELYDWSGAAVYDLHLVGIDRWRLIEGRAFLRKTVTREG